nr:hypothetical protein Iba_chr03cCG1840 [Ipomoea batatas]
MLDNVIGPKEAPLDSGPSSARSKSYKILPLAVQSEGPSLE